MSEQVDNFDLGATEAPENRERVYLKPGFHKLTVEGFEYEKEEDGKTPLITMRAFKEEDGNKVEFSEKLYISGKLNSKGVMTSVTRLQELYKGLTGEDKMTLKPTKYSYEKKEQNGTSEKYVIPNPKELCDYLNKKCAGKTAVFKIGGEETEDGKVFVKLTYSGFLYFTDRKGDLCRYKEEREFTESERKYAVQKRKSDAPAHNNGIANTTALDEL